MRTVINPVTGREVKEFESTAERLAFQNATYHSWREKLEKDPVKLAAFRARKNAASKKCLAKKAAKLAELQRRVEELESQQ